MTILTQKKTGELSTGKKSAGVEDMAKGWEEATEDTADLLKIANKLRHNHNKHPRCRKIRAVHQQHTQSEAAATNTGKEAK
jgi:hypothetical protein